MTSSPCPCGSGSALDDCCGPYIAGAPAPTAQALMRSRYSAYVLGKFGYLAETLAPELRGDFDVAEAKDAFGNTRWDGLEIRAATGGGPDDETGTVEFIARYRAGGERRLHHELSSFRREGGRWVFDGEVMNPKAPPRQAAKVGRNAPCPCGSGKKYKKCCGA